MWRGRRRERYGEAGADQTTQDPIDIGGEATWIIIRFSNALDRRKARGRGGRTID